MRQLSPWALVAFRHGDDGAGRLPTSDHRCYVGKTTWLS